MNKQNIQFVTSVVQNISHYIWMQVKTHSRDV